MSSTNSRSSKRLKGSANREPAAATAEDNSFPTCDVFLYTRPICGKWGKHPFNAKHWVLYFEWNWGYSYHFEANDDEGKLTPSEDKGKPEEVLSGPHDNNDMKYKVEKVKEKLRFSPEEVKAKAKENIFSGVDYKKLNANCQTWVTELGRLLEIDLPLDQAAKADGLATGFLGGTAIFGSTLLASSLTSTTGQKRNRTELCFICDEECDEERSDYSADLWIKLKETALKWKGLDKYGDLYDKIAWDDGSMGLYFHKLCKAELASQRKLDQAMTRKQKQMATQQLGESRKKEN